MPLDNVEFQNDIYDNKVTFPEQEVYTFFSVDPQEDDFALFTCCPPGHSSYCRINGGKVDLIL